MPIPSLQLQKKPVICSEAEGLVTELWSKDLFQYSDCALSCAMWLLQTSEQRAFSNSEFWSLASSLSATDVAKCDALPKGDVLDLFV